MTQDNTKMEFKIKFNSQDSDGNKIPDSEILKGEMVKSVLDALEYDQKDTQKSVNHPMVFVGAEKVEVADVELEKKLEEIIDDFEEAYDSFDVSELDEERANDGKSRMTEIIKKWDDVASHYNEGKRRPTLLSEIEDCKKEIEGLLSDVRIWREEKRENLEFLEENKGWQEQFKQASALIEEFKGTADEFEKKYAKRNKQLNFTINLKESLLEYAEISDEDVKGFSAKGWRAWRKAVGAAKMINNPIIPETVVIFDNRSYNIKADKKKSIENDSVSKNESVEFLNKAIIARLQEKFVDVRNIFGKPINEISANLRYIAFIVGKEIIEDRAILNRLEGEKNNKTISKEEIARIDGIIEKLLDNKGKGANELAVRVFVYNELGKINSGLVAGLKGKERFIKEQELVDAVLMGFNDKLKKRIKSFIENREYDGKGVGAKMSNNTIVQITKAIHEYVANVFGAEEDKTDIEPEKLTEVEAENTDTEKITKTESELKLEIEKNHIIDDLLISFHSLIEEVEGKKKEKHNKTLIDFIEETNVFLHRLHDTELTKELKVECNEIKKRIDDKCKQLASEKTDIADTAEFLINEKNQLIVGDAISKKLFESWKKLPDFERESLEFEGIYRTLDFFGERYFREELDRFKSKAKVSEKEKGEYIKQLIVRLQILNNMVEEKLGEMSEAKKTIPGTSLEQKNEKRKKQTNKEDSISESETVDEVVDDKDSAIQQRIETLRWEFLDAKKKYEDLYKTKSESYKTVLSGLGNKAAHDRLMADDGDVAFYRKDYQEIKERYLMACLENANIQINILSGKIEKKDLKPGWIKKHWNKISSLFKGTALGSASLEILPKTESEEAEKTASIEVLVEEEKSNKFEYVGGYNKLKQDLLVVMNMIVKTEKSIIDSLKPGEKAEVIRDIKLKDLLDRKNEKGREYFKKLPIDAQILIEKMSKTKYFFPINDGLTLRMFIQRVLVFVKSNNAPGKV